MRFSNESLVSALDAAIPGGCHTYSKGRDVFSYNAPALLLRGKGSKVWDIAHKKYLDYGMGLKSVVLGYSNHEVNKSAKKAASLGNNLSRPSYIELIAAEKLISLIPGIESVKFAKNGSNVTTAALKIARAYTGRNYIGVPTDQPFFSFDDWFIGSTPARNGIPLENSKYTFRFRYGSIENLEVFFRKYKGKIAAIMLEPAVKLLDCDIPNNLHNESCAIQHQIQSTSRYLNKLKVMCEKNGTLLIFDEMRTGFRWNLRGAQTLFECIPHISTFGKAMANGFSLAALGGMREVMSVGSTNVSGTPRTFLLSSTHGAEMASLGAFLKTCQIMEEENVVDYLWNFGEKLSSKLKQIFGNSLLNEYISIEGPPIALDLNFKDNDTCRPEFVKTLFYETLTDQRVLMPTITQSFSHSSKDLNRTVRAFENVLERMETTSPEKWESQIAGHILKPVFREYN